METTTKLLVHCPNRDICVNYDCPHYDPHEPIQYGHGFNCSTEFTICPLAGKAICLCEAVKY